MNTEPLKPLPKLGRYTCYCNFGLEQTGEQKDEIDIVLTTWLINKITNYNFLNRAKSHATARSIYYKYNIDVFHYQKLK